MRANLLTFKRQITFAAVVIAVLCNTVSGRAQGWGIELGMGHHTQQGDFQAPCGCHFTDGTGNGFNGGITDDIVSFAGFTIGAKLGVDFKHINSSHGWPSPTPFLTDNAEISTTYIEFQPYARFLIPSTSIFVQAAAAASRLTASNFFQHRELINGNTYGNGSKDTTLEDGSFGDINSMIYSAKLSAGYELHLGGIIVAPMVTYDVPISEIKTYSNDFNSSNWKISSLYGTVAIRFGL